MEHENIKPGGGDAHPDPVKNLRAEEAAIEACNTMALELIGVLREEAAILKHFRGEELLRILPRKEFLIGELTKRMQGVLDVIKRTGAADGDEHVGSLKCSLMEVERLNRANRTFIEGSLEYWQELFSLFCTPNYSPKGESPYKNLSFKGLGLSKEI